MSHRLRYSQMGKYGGILGIRSHLGRVMIGHYLIYIAKKSLICQQSQALFRAYRLILLAANNAKDAKVFIV